MISLHNISKQFGKLQALQQVSAAFQKGKTYAVIGPNGSGKTTLIKCILGMVLPDSGTIEINGQNILGHWAYREQIGYMPQIGRYPDNLKIRQLFDMVRDLRKHPGKPDEDLVHEFHLDQIGDKRLHTLSGGTRQKVSGALAFLFNPPILILDEPTAGLDPLAVEILKAKIQKEKTNGRLFLITSHIMSDLDELSSEVTYMEEGTIRYDGAITRLKEETGEEKLGPAIASIMRKNQEGIRK